MVCLLFLSSGLRMGGRALSREVICPLPPGTAILRGGRGTGRALRARCRILGFWDSRILVSGSRRAALPRGRILARFRRPEIPPRDPEMPRIPESGPRCPGRPGPSLQPGRRPWRPEGTGMRAGCVSRGSAPRSVSSPGLLGKPCLKTRKETRSNGAHPCFVPFKLECSKDSGERRLAVCCFSAASVRACALRAATSENIPDSGFRRKRIPK